MDEITFVVTDDPKGGFLARALGESILTDADDMKTLRANVREAVICHFDEGSAPRTIHLHYVRDEVIAV